MLHFKHIAKFKIANKKEKKNNHKLNINRVYIIKGDDNCGKMNIDVVYKNKQNPFNCSDCNKYILIELCNDLNRFGNVCPSNNENNRPQLRNTCYEIKNIANVI